MSPLLDASYSKLGKNICEFDFHFVKKYSKSLKISTWEDAAGHSGHHIVRIDACRMRPDRCKFLETNLHSRLLMTYSKQIQTYILIGAYNNV